MEQELLEEFKKYLEKQDMLNKLTENQSLNEHGYSEIHTIVAIETLKEANVTSIAGRLKMTRGAISKITKKLVSKGLITPYTIPGNKQKIFFQLTEEGKVLYEAHEVRHNLWLERDCKFLSAFPEETFAVIFDFMKQYNEYLESQITELVKQEEGEK